MRCQLPGRFLVHALGDGWRLSRAEPHPVDLYLRGAQGAQGVGGAGEDDGLQVLRTAAHVADIGIDWQAASVVLTLTSAGRSVTVSAQSAIVHEPLPQLYEVLPLARLDARAARFWRRVFWLIRIPGGRRLIEALARRRRRD